MNLTEMEFTTNLINLKALCGHTYSKSRIYEYCNKFGFRSFQVCIALNSQGYWNK